MSESLVPEKEVFFSFLRRSFVRSLCQSRESGSRFSTQYHIHQSRRCRHVHIYHTEKGKRKKERKQKGRKKKERNKGNIKNKTNELLGMSDFILLLFCFVLFCFLNHFPSYYSVCSIHGYLSFPFLLRHVVDILNLFYFLFCFIWV